MRTATPVADHLLEHGPSEAPVPTVDASGHPEDPFVLGVRVISDVRPELLPTACDTNDGCKPSCASSCTST
ncbi:FxLD family lantipeptide [Streptomyces durbertensis]|uniref:FxLD family lantipeptide n=1 Tax=Streptomyces durbertensis TaxID=2448886 RepID=A0ABR6EI47_9ACTN|nr:FxLD family lanthipeptide [Streptomyces durbertensis]MBB1245014.1 FxLD family lantipeptide [Streptomyces durbertensis]